MVKKLLSIAAVLVLFSVVALAQEAPGGGPAGGPGPMALQEGRGGPMPRSGSHTFNIRVRGPMGNGPRMWFHRAGMGEWWNNPEVAQRIGLSEQQKQQLGKISLDSRLKMIDLRADLEKQQVILGPMLQTYHPDETAVLAQVEKVSQARAALEKQRVQTMLESRSVLTEDQWNQWKNGRMVYRRSFGRRVFHGPVRQPTAPTTPQSK